MGDPDLPTLFSLRRCLAPYEYAEYPTSSANLSRASSTSPAPLRSTSIATSAYILPTYAVKVRITAYPGKQVVCSKVLPSPGIGGETANPIRKPIRVEILLRGLYIAAGRIKIGVRVLEQSNTEYRPDAARCTGRSGSAADGCKSAGQAFCYSAGSKRKTIISCSFAVAEFAGELP